MDMEAEGLLVRGWQMGGGGPGLVRTGTGGGGLPGMRQQGAGGGEGATRVEIQRAAPPQGGR